MEDQNIKIKVTKSVPKASEEVVKQTADPVVKESVKHTSVPVERSVNNKANITIIALDAKGEEKGSEFQVNERTYVKSFSDTSKFKVKKKAI